MRVDVLAKLRGVDSFPDLWVRRTTVEVPEGEILDVLSLPDLVKSKKTQRDQDWPMLRRVGLSAAPADADPRIRERVDVVLGARGGRGAVREMAELVLMGRGLFDEIAERFQLAQPATRTSDV